MTDVRAGLILSHLLLKIHAIAGSFPLSSPGGPYAENMRDDGGARTGCA